MTQKVWFITGAARGFGHIRAPAALAQLAGWEPWEAVSNAGQGASIHRAITA